MQHQGLKQITDPVFLLALILGPVVWGLLWMLGTGSGGKLTALVLLNTVLLYPLLEELAFRGFLQGWLLEHSFFNQQLAGLTAANLLTSFLFAMAHLLNQPPLWAAGVFFPSLVFGFFRDRHQSVATPFLLHAWYNAGFLVVMYA